MGEGGWASLAFRSLASATLLHRKWDNSSDMAFQAELPCSPGPQEASAFSCPRPLQHGQWVFPIENQGFQEEGLSGSLHCPVYHSAQGRDGQAAWP
jgi:hypothetical protein